MVMVLDIMDMESVMLMLYQKLRPMLSMVLMEDMVLDTVLMVTEILATLLLVMVMDMVLAMDLTDMESVKLRLSQRLMPMLSMALMEDMVLDTVLILWDMVMDILLMAMDMALAMAIMDMVLDTVLIL